MATVPPPSLSPAKTTTFRFRGLVASVDEAGAVATIPLKSVAKVSGALHGLPTTCDIKLRVEDYAGPPWLKPDVEITFEVEVGDEPGAYKAVKATALATETPATIKRYRGQVAEVDGNGGKIELHSVCSLDGLVVEEGHNLLTQADLIFMPTDCSQALRVQLKPGTLVNFQALRVPSDPPGILRAIKLEPVLSLESETPPEDDRHSPASATSKAPSVPPPAAPVIMHALPVKEPAVMVTNGMAGGHPNVKHVSEAAWNEARRQESGLRKFFETDMTTMTAGASAFNAAVDTVLAPDAHHLDQVLEMAASLKVKDGISPFDQAVAKHATVYESSGLDDLLEEFNSRCLRFKLSNNLRDMLLPFIGGSTHYIHTPVALRLVEALNVPMTDDERQRLFDKLVGVIDFFKQRGRLTRLSPPIVPIDLLVEIFAGSPISYFFIDEERREKAKRGQISAQEAPEIRFMCNLFGQTFADMVQLFNGDRLCPQSQFKQAMPPVSTMSLALQAVADRIFDHVVIFSSDYRALGKHWKGVKYEAGGDPVVIGLISIGDDRALPFFFPLGNRASGRGIASGNDMLLAHAQEMVRKTLKENPNALEGFNDPELTWYDVNKKAWISHKQTLADGSIEGDRGAYLKHVLKNAARALEVGSYYDWLRGKWDPLQS